MKVSNRVLSMQESPIRKLVPYADEAKKNGKKVYHLNIGQPDLETPKEYLDAIKNFKEPVLAYAHSQGISELLDSLVEYFRINNYNFKKEDIIVTNAGSEALIFALMASCDHGDEVLVPEPFYTNYNGFASIAGVNVVPITTYAENGFHLPAKEEITKLITDKTKAILFANPGNPTGTVYTRDELNMLKDIAIDHDLFIITDEVYKEFVYDGHEFISFSHLEGVDDRVIATDSISKRYSACGARVGCVASKNKEVMKNIMKLAQARLCVATLEQVGAANLANVPSEYLEEVKQEYWNRRDVVYNALSNMKDVLVEKPRGAFYNIAKLPVEDAEDFVIWLLKDFDLDNETVMLAPAEGFYATPGLGKDEVRISYCLNTDDLKRAMEILEKGLEEYKNR